MSPFSSRTLVALLAIGLLTFGLGLLLAAFGPDVFEQRSAGNDSYSRSLVGHRALTELLRRAGLVVVIGRQADQHRANASFPLLLLEPEPARAPSLEELVFDHQTGPMSDLDREQRLRGLIQTAQSQGAEVLVALPKWKVVDSLRTPGWIESQRLIPISQVETLLADLIRAEQRRDEEVEYQGSDQPSAVAVKLTRTPVMRHLRAPELGLDAPRVDLGENAQLLSATEGLTPLVECEQGVLVGELPGGVTLISDPDLLNNRGLGQGEHADLLLALLRDRFAAQGVVIDETEHGFVTGETLLARAMRFPLVVIVIHALIAMALAAWSLGLGFGRPRTPPPQLPPGKQLLIDNTARLLLAGGDHSEALRRYLRVSLSRVARRFSLGTAPSPGRRGLEPEQALLPQLQAIGDARGQRVDLAGLMAASRDPSLRPNEALRLARRIHVWRMALQGAAAKPLARRRERN
jgi:hypothetical protein